MFVVEIIPRTLSQIIIIISLCFLLVSVDLNVWREVGRSFQNFLRTRNMSHTLWKVQHCFRIKSWQMFRPFNNTKICNIVYICLLSDMMN
jgi:hypothetical protein